MFHVRRRRFAILNHLELPYRKRWASSGNSLHFATDKKFLETLSTTRFSVSPHHGFRGWRAVSISEETDWTEIAYILESAFKAVAAKEIVKEMEQASADDASGSG